MQMKALFGEDFFSGTMGESMVLKIYSGLENTAAQLLS